MKKDKEIPVISDIDLTLTNAGVVFIDRSFDNDEYISSILKQLWIICSIKREVVIYIKSTGGEVSNGLALYNLIQAFKNKRKNKVAFNIICLSEVCSMATMLLAGGTKGKRFAYSNSRIMIHPIRTENLDGKVADIKITSKELDKQNDILINILHKHTGQDYNKIKEDTKQDYWMSAKEAKRYGIIDHIINVYPKIMKRKKR